MFMLERWIESLIIGLLVGSVIYFVFGLFGYERTGDVLARDCAFVFIGFFIITLFFDGFEV
jgi:predicted histidine transporter YuiF (NhaC family)